MPMDVLSAFQTDKKIMGYSRKNPNRGVEDMEFLGVLKKKHEEIPGVS